MKIPPTRAGGPDRASLLGIVLEIVRHARRKNRFPLSPVGLGLGFIIPFHTCLSMFLGSFIFWLLEKLAPANGEQGEPGRGAEPGADLRRPDRRRGADGHSRYGDRDDIAEIEPGAFSHRWTFPVAELARVQM